MPGLKAMHELATHMDHHTLILVVDDDPDLRKLIGDFLQGHGYRVETAENAAVMRERIDKQRPDLVILDVMMPGEDGLSAARKLVTASGPPVIMLSALGSDTDRIIGLEMGADDYLPKPFAARELLARIKAVLRRTRMLPPNLQISEAGQLLTFGNWQLDTVGRHLIDKDGTEVALSGAEYRMLRVFIDHPQRVLNRDQLLNLTQGRDSEIFDRSIDLMVSRLRQRLGVR